jgi:hypothetical protein
MATLIYIGNLGGPTPARPGAGGLGKQCQLASAPAPGDRRGPVTRPALMRPRLTQETVNHG